MEDVRIVLEVGKESCMPYFGGKTSRFLLEVSMIKPNGETYVRQNLPDYIAGKNGKATEAKKD